MICRDRKWDLDLQYFSPVTLWAVTCNLFSSDSWVKGKGPHSHNHTHTFIHAFFSIPEHLVKHTHPPKDGGQVKVQHLAQKTHKHAHLEEKGSNPWTLQLQSRTFLKLSYWPLYDLQVLIRNDPQNPSDKGGWKSLRSYMCLILTRVEEKGIRWAVWSSSACSVMRIQIHWCELVRLKFCCGYLFR